MHPLSVLSRGTLAVLVVTLLHVSTAEAQDCASLPASPTGAVTTSQDRDQMMCQLGRVFPQLPVRQGTEWPWNDPTAPTNAWPRSLGNPVAVTRGVSGPANHLSRCCARPNAGHLDRPALEWIVAHLDLHCSGVGTLSALGKDQEGDIFV